MTAVPAIGKNRYLPVREMTCPGLIETRSSPTSAAAGTPPRSPGEIPLTTWKNAGRKVIVSNIVKPTMKPTTSSPRRCAAANRCNGSDRLGGAPLDEDEQADQRHAGRGQGAGDPHG